MCLLLAPTLFKLRFLSIGNRFRLSTCIRHKWLDKICYVGSRFMTRSKRFSELPSTHFACKFKSWMWGAEEYKSVELSVARELKRLSACHCTLYCGTLSSMAVSWQNGTAWSIFWVQSRWQSSSISSKVIFWRIFESWISYLVSTWLV